VVNTFGYINSVPFSSVNLFECCEMNLEASFKHHSLLRVKGISVEIRAFSLNYSKT
jgi:hypothetical protein